MNIGILGGTFDPIHNGHIALATAAHSFLKLDRVLFVPTFIPPHKDRPDITEPEHRVHMINTALSEYPFFQVSTSEIEKQRIVYTVETVRELREQAEPGTEFFFLAGSDALDEFDTWRNKEEILDLCTFVIAPRPGFLAEDLPKRMHLLPGTFPAISSTAIRTAIAQGNDVSAFLPLAVEAFIRQNKLYANT